MPSLIFYRLMDVVSLKLLQMLYLYSQKGLKRQITLTKLQEKQERYRCNEKHSAIKILYVAL